MINNVPKKLIFLWKFSLCILSRSDSSPSWKKYYLAFRWDCRVSCETLYFVSDRTDYKRNTKLFRLYFGLFRETMKFLFRILNRTKCNRNNPKLAKMKINRAKKIRAKQIETNWNKWRKNERNGELWVGFSLTSKVVSFSSSNTPKLPVSLFRDTT
jgi:hypothetical protein